MESIVHQLLSKCVVIFSVVVLFSAPGFADPIEFQLGTVLSETETVYHCFETLAERVSERSKGDMTIELFPNSSLGGDPEYVTMALKGTRVIGFTNPGFLAPYVPDFSILIGPFLFHDYTEAQELAQSAWGQEMTAQLAEQGIRLLAMDWFFGARHFISNTPITKPSNLHGVKVRVLAAKMWVETMKALGGEPFKLEWREVYQGLAQGVVDVAEAPLSTLYGAKLYEVGKHVALTGHFLNFSDLIMSETVWRSMSAQQQQILSEEIREVGRECSRTVADSEREWQQQLERHGMVFNTVDRAAFAKAAESVYTQFPEWTPGLLDRIKSELAH